MKRIGYALLLALSFFSYSAVRAQGENLIDSLTTIDPEMRRYFPRWRVCEPNLQFQIFKAFEMLGYPKDQLDIQNIEVLASPMGPKDKVYEILLISCGTASMNTRTMDAELKTIVRTISGQNMYRKENVEDKSKKGIKERDYCYTEIPPDAPLNVGEFTTIQDYYLPTNKRQAFSLSLFEQALKIGSTDFIIKSKIGTDEIGYPFWESGEAKIILQRPLYKNFDPATARGIPNLINAYLGGGFRVTSGVNNSGLFGWVNNRMLNDINTGKLVAGLDVHMPFMPQAGIHINAEVPITPQKKEDLNVLDWGGYENGINPLTSEKNVQFIDPTDPRAKESINKILPVLQATGQVTAFYNLWVEDQAPENFFRFDLGISYNEVQEYALYGKTLDKDGISGLRMFKNNEFGDWVYAKVEYRNQSTYPFSMSMQYSNQILLSKAYMPLFGNWLLLEAKYATPLRGVRPYEIKNYFMISPVLRITI